MIVSSLWNLELYGRNTFYLYKSRVQLEKSFRWLLLFQNRRYWTSGRVAVLCCFCNLLQWFMIKIWHLYTHIQNLFLLYWLHLGVILYCRLDALVHFKRLFGANILHDPKIFMWLFWIQYILPLDVRYDVVHSI